MMWGSFGLGVSMMLISILLSFKSEGGSVAKSTASASVVSLICRAAVVIADFRPDFLLHRQYRSRPKPAEP